MNSPATQGPPGGRGPGMARAGAEKARDFTGTWKKLLLYCRKYYVPILIAVLCAAGGTVFTLVGPDRLSDLTKVITDGLMTGIDMEAVAGIGITLVIFYACGALLSFIQHFIMTTISQAVSNRMRSDISRKINCLPMSFYSRTSTAISCPESPTMWI